MTIGPISEITSTSNAITFKPSLPLTSLPTTDIADNEPEMSSTTVSDSIYELDLTLGYPNLPLYNNITTTNNITTNSGTIRSRVMQEQALRMYPVGSRVQQVMEERIIRWRPPTSQHGTETVILGNHIYQQDSQSEGSWGCNWNWRWRWNWDWSSWRIFRRNQTVDMNEHRQTIVDSEHMVESIVLPDLEGQRLDLNQFKPNSSRSILEEIKPNRTNYNYSSPLSATTPRAILWSDFELHYDKQEDPMYSNQGNPNDTVLSMDQEVQNLVEGVDNFVGDCFFGTLSFISSCCTAESTS